MMKDTLCMCLELKDARTFWDSIVCPICIPIPTRPQKGIRDSHCLPRVLPCCPLAPTTEACVSTTRLAPRLLMVISFRTLNGLGILVCSMDGSVAFLDFSQDELGDPLSEEEKVGE